MRRRFNRSMDARAMAARFGGKCPRCQKWIDKGSQIIYWPATKTAEHYKCAEEDFRRAQAEIMDEEMASCGFVSYGIGGQHD